MPSEESAPATGNDPRELRTLAATIAAGILANPQSGSFDANISPNEINNIADISVRVATAIVEKTSAGK